MDLLGKLQWHRRVLVAMEDPAGQILDAVGHDPAHPGAAADRRDRRVGVGIFERRFPGAEAAHAQAGQVEALTIDAVGGGHVVGHGLDPVRIPDARLLALQAGDDGRQFLACGNELRRAMLLEQFQVVAALARTMQEDDERPGLGGVGLVTLGQGEQVAVTDLQFHLALEGLRRLFRRRGGNSEEGEAGEGAERVHGGKTIAIPPGWQAQVRTGAVPRAARAACHGGEPAEAGRALISS